MRLRKSLIKGVKGPFSKDIPVCAKFVIRKYRTLGRPHAGRWPQPPSGSLYVPPLPHTHDTRQKWHRV